MADRSGVAALFRKLERALEDHPAWQVQDAVDGLRAALFAYGVSMADRGEGMGIGDWQRHMEPDGEILPDGTGSFNGYAPGLEVGRYTESGWEWCCTARSGKDADRIVRALNATSAGGHVLYAAGDPDLPPSILDRNGDVALALCRRCGRGEADLDQPCTPSNQRLSTPEER